MSNTSNLAIDTEFGIRELMEDIRDEGGTESVKIKIDRFIVTKQVFRGDMMPVPLQAVNNVKAMVEEVVNQTVTSTLDKELGRRIISDSKISNQIKNEVAKSTREELSQVFQSVGQMGRLTHLWGKLSKNSKAKLDIKNLEEKFLALSGIYNAYQSGDAISGAMSGYQLGQALGGSKFGPIGAALGLIAGLVSPGIDKWQRYKFKDAETAYEKLFFVDRGERDMYTMPESFYFRGGGWPAQRGLTVYIGNNQFDDHIRQSLTNSYSSQLERGLAY